MTTLSSLKDATSLSPAQLATGASKQRIASFAVLFAAVCIAAIARPAAAQAVNFGKVNVCSAGKTTPAPCSATQTVTFTIPAGTTLGSIVIGTNGIPNLDFKAKANDTSATLCKAQHYSSATTCTVDVTFTPLAPGARNGAVELTDSTTVITSAYIYGVGVGPQIAFSPSISLSLGGGVSVPQNLVVDGAGNIFVTDFATDYTEGSGEVVEILAAGGYTTIKTIDVPFPYSTAVDGAGNLFVSDNNGETVEEIFPVGGYTTVKTLITDPDTVNDLAVDGAGNIFVLQNTGAPIKEFLAASGYSTSKVLGSGITSVDSIALDSDGNVFVCDIGNSAVKEILAAGGYTTVKTLASGITSLGSIAVDAAENVFVVQVFRTNQVSEIVAAGGYTAINVLNFPNSYSPVSLALDSSGNVYSAGYYNDGPDDSSPVAELQRSQLPPSINFVNTAVGEASANSPLSVQVQNIGNAPLAGTFDLSDETDFTIVPGPGIVPDCSLGTFSLNSAQACNLSIDFLPKSEGLHTTELTLTDNSGKTAGATYSATLFGTGASTTAVLKLSSNALNYGSVPYPNSATQTLTITNAGTGILSVHPSSPSPQVVVTGNTCPADIAAAQSCTVQVKFIPLQLGPNANSLRIWSNTAASPTVPVTSTATGVGSLASSIQFPTVYPSTGAVSGQLTVTNYGVPGSVKVATADVTAPFSVTSNGCTSGIISGETCTIKLAFAPTQPGNYTDNLELIPSTGVKQVITLAGTELPSTD
jgi:sugar lactone lactonase YvrE